MRYNEPVQIKSSHLERAKSGDKLESPENVHAAVASLFVANFAWRETFFVYIAVQKHVNSEIKTKIIVNSSIN